MIIPQEKIESILTGAVIGETLGRSFNGISKGHLHSHFKTISGYSDPAPALKGKMDKWTKPGLYSSLIQLMILSSLCSKRNILNKKLFTEMVQEGLSSGTGEFGIFRTPSLMEKYFFQSISDTEKNAPSLLQRTLRFSILIIPMSLFDMSLKNLILSIISFLSLFNADIQSIVSALSLRHGLSNIAASQHHSPKSLINDICNTNDEMIREIKNCEAAIFENGINPIDLKSAFDELNSILNEIRDISDPFRTEEIICHWLNTSLKTPITRATVDMPFALYPYALSFYQINHERPENILYQALLEGGATSCLTSITGILSGLYYGIKSFPQELINSLINKNNLYTIINNISDGGLTKNLPDTFIKAEAGLTIKEDEERSARLKHIKQKPEKKKTKESDLNRHVVESWTKIDKARWKKERKNRNNI